MKSIWGWGVLALFALVWPADAQVVYDAHTEVELVSSVEAIRAGEPFEVAVRMKTDPGWHVYWKNSGDSGLPPVVHWNLPDGFRAGAIGWPIPERLQEAELTTYGYTQGVFLIAEIVSPPAIAENTVTLKAHVDWLACEKICVPGKADLLLNLEVGPVALASGWANDFAQTRSRWPQPIPWPVSAFQDARSIGLNVVVPADQRSQITSLEFFPDQNDLIVHSAAQTLRATGRGFELLVPKSTHSTSPILKDGARGSTGSPSLEPSRAKSRDSGLTLSVSSLPRLERRGLRIVEESTIQTGKVNALSGIVVVRDTAGARRAFVVAVDKVAAATPSGVPVLPGISLGVALLFAFIGGLILNLMPCVLPVLSIKVLSLVEHTGERKKALLSGAVFTLGVLVSFWLLAGILIALKALGRQIGWGFQFQSPVFLIAMCLILFVFALNLWGLFEINVFFPQAVAYINRRHGYSKAFFSGVLAVVLATPCTAPFMGTAIGFAVTQSAFVNLLIFTSLGLGLAFPFTILSAFPQCLKFVPRPGPWMKTFKKFLALLLIGTIVWLIWVLSYVVDTRAPAKQVRTDESSIHWLDYSPELMHKLAQEGKTVFLDFTAKWCLSCQVNERVALQKKEVADKFRELGVVAVKADWTRFDARITRALAELGKNSIPVYVIYYGENHRDMKVLPEIITPQIVLDALETIKK